MYTNQINFNAYKKKLTEILLLIHVQGDKAKNQKFILKAQGMSEYLIISKNDKVVLLTNLEDSVFYLIPTNIVGYFIIVQKFPSNCLAYKSGTDSIKTFFKTCDFSTYQTGQIFKVADSDFVENVFLSQITFKDQYGAAIGSLTNVVSELILKNANSHHIAKIYNNYAEVYFENTTFTPQVTLISSEYQYLSVLDVVNIGPSNIVIYLNHGCSN